ncbi:hypothetical protein T484DRAFT_1964987 [Baffinella frigidus]|nr:hypothetical protein T484DRAFT_1964987 [Cryptophyta sp. CCMP2293]
MRRHCRRRRRLAKGASPPPDGRSWPRIEIRVKLHCAKPIPMPLLRCAEARRPCQKEDAASVLAVPGDTTPPTEDAPPSFEEQFASVAILQPPLAVDIASWNKEPRRMGNRLLEVRQARSAGSSPNQVRKLYVARHLIQQPELHQR